MGRNEPTRRHDRQRHSAHRYLSRKVVDFDAGVHLGALDVATLPLRSIDGPRLAAFHPDRARQHRRHRSGPLVPKRMIVKRRKLSFWERLYLPAIIGGFKVTVRHFFRKKITMQYPEEKWTVPPGYRGAPYLVKNPEGRTKCVSCQLCEFVCPPKAIRITPPGPPGSPQAGNVEKAPRRSEEHTSELQSRLHLVCRLLLEKKNLDTSISDKHT